MEFRCGRCHDLEVREVATRLELLRDLFEKRTFPVIAKVVNRESRQDEIEASERRDGDVQVPLGDGDAMILGKSRACLLEHELRSIYRQDSIERRTDVERQSRKPTVTTSKIEQRSSRRRQNRAENFFARNSGR